ncbi:MAG TPA: 2-C-methyl-D-erythritol 4-phosphate cytidylyltransferase, partial [Methanobacteriaceae archaeon]|nr:2-C-methyl-D-erythritol 4-phosphate cytidylyltransferase [Methanobacteriaceae archaeon]
QMIFAAVLAGGMGSRMGNEEKPKQYMLLGNKPIILHTIEKFHIHQDFEKVIVLCPKQWINYTQDLVDKHIGKSNHIVVIEGGNTRNETIMNAIYYIEDNYDIDAEAVLVTHDSVRPFVTHRIIKENIECALKYQACDTVIPATDTIVSSQDGVTIQDIPNRKVMYQGQTPQSFRILKLKELYHKLTDEERMVLTDAAKIFTLNQEKVYLVDGDVTNIKITYPYDLKVANTILQGNR